MGAMIPCHNPAPARATRPSASGWLSMGFGPGAVSNIVESGVEAVMLVLGVQAAITADSVTSRPNRSTFFMSTSGIIILSFTCVTAMKRTRLNCERSGSGSNPLYNKTSPVRSLTGEVYFLCNHAALPPSASDQAQKQKYKGNADQESKVIVPAVVVYFIDLHRWIE